MRRIHLILTAVLFMAISTFADDTKRADLAGSWYPASPKELKALIDGYLKAANPEKIEGDTLAIIVPHAGYQFSGPVAAYSFKALAGKDIKTAILIGFSHRKPFNGIAIYDKGAFETPLGRIDIDVKLASKIMSRNSRIFYNPQAFTDENSLEMEIPFIQKSLKGARIVPIAFGTQSYEDAVILSGALAEALKDERGYVLIASTDLSHYHPYAEANAIDRHFIKLLEGMKAKELYDDASLRICEACGVMPVTTVLLTAERLGFDKVKILKYANSGDTSGNKDNVVGYLSAVVYKGPGSRGQGQEKEKAMLNESQRKRLLQIARESITSYVKDGKRKEFNETDPVLNEEMGAFVTLHENGELRGCIGNMIARGPLYKTIADMAVESATGDPRFRPLSAQEIDKIDIEVSVLSPLKKVSGPEAIKVPGHGVLVRKGFNSGVYLPQVADETGWSKEEFLTSLCAHKAGLKPDAWKDPATELYVFSAEVFGEKDR